MQIKLKKEFGTLADYVYAGNDDSHKESLIPYKAIDGRLGKDELPSPTRDNIFKLMFAREETKKYACRLFESILDVNSEDFIEGMRLCRNEMTEIWLGKKSVRMDFVGRYRGVIFSMEMNGTNETERNTDYAYRLYSIDANKKKPKYRWVVQMNIANYENKKVNKAINISVTTNGEVRRSKIIYIDVYLPVIKRKYENGGINSLIEAERVILAMFIANKKIALELAQNEELLVEFIEDLEALKGEKKVMEEYDKMEDAKKTGIAIGREQAMEEAKVEIDKVKKEVKISREKAKKEGVAIGREQAMEEAKVEIDKVKKEIKMSREKAKEEGVAIGREQAMEEGVAIGREQAMEEAVKIMLKDGLSLETIQKYTNVALDQIMSLI